jgi:multiple sugar transport system substrate-binding protein
MPISDNGAQASVIGGENFGVCTGAKNVEACVDFLEYMETAQANADWCEIAGKLPVRADAVELKDFWTEDERYAVFNESMNFAVARGPHAEWPTISEAIYTAEQAVLLGEKDAATAAADAAAVIDPILAENPLPTTD